MQLVNSYENNFKDGVAISKMLTERTENGTLEWEPVNFSAFEPKRFGCTIRGIRYEIEYWFLFSDLDTTGWTTRLDVNNQVSYIQPGYYGHQKNDFSVLFHLIMDLYKKAILEEKRTEELKKKKAYDGLMKEIWKR